MRKICSILFFLFPLFCTAQNTSFVEQKDFESIITYLGKEDWSNADKLIAASLKKCPDDQLEAETAGMLRYMYIFSEAGLMNEKKLSMEKAFENVKPLMGHAIVLPGTTISLKLGFNVIQPSNDKTDTLLITASNHDATQLFSFTYIIPASPISMDDFSKAAGKTALTKGNLQSICVEGISLPRFRVYIDKAEVLVD